VRLTPGAPPVGPAQRLDTFKTGLPHAEVTRMEYVSRCPACSSLVRPGQDWCTLCHADLRPPERRAPAPVEPPELLEHDWAEPLPEPTALLLADRPQTSDPITDLSSDPLGAQPPVVGKHARHAAPEEPAVAGGALPDAEVSQLFAELAASSEDPLGGVLSKLPESQSMRVMVALAVGGTVAVVLVGVSWILGLVFG
jgi:hypothetical protein